jgi:hypothetical protein
MLWRAKQTEFSQKTIHEYKNAAFSLFAWMERHDRLENNPLRRVGNVERKGYEKVRRRSFTHEEMGRLLAVAGEYALGYVAAVNTGLRRKELCSVQWGDVHLAASSPFIMVRSCTTKKPEGRKNLLEITVGVDAQRNQARVGYGRWTGVRQPDCSPAEDSRTFEGGGNTGLQPTRRKGGFPRIAEDLQHEFGTGRSIVASPAGIVTPQ